MSIPTPTSYWNFNHTSGDAIDSVGSNNLTNNGSAVFSAGKIGRAGTLVRNTDYFSIADGSQSGLKPTGPFSINMWVKWASITDSNWNGLVSKMDNTSRAYGTALLRSGSTYTLGFDIGTSGGSSYSTQQTITAPTTGVWYMYTFVFNASTHTSSIYIDGVSQVADTGAPSSAQAGTAEFRIGWYNNPSGSDGSDADIDMVGFFGGTALSQSEIDELYNSGSGVELPTNRIQFNSVSENVNDASPATLSHTTNGVNRILFVGARIDATTDDLSGITYNGVAMTRINTLAAGSGERLYLYYIVAPATGANNIVATAAGRNIVLRATSYTGANQTGQPDGSDTTGFTSSVTSIVNDITTTADNCWMVVFARNDTADFTASTNTVIRNASNRNIAIADNNTSITPAGAYSMTMTMSSSRAGSVAASLSPYAVASGPANLKSYNTNLKANIKSINTNVIANVKSLNTNA